MRDPKNTLPPRGARVPPKVPQAAARVNAQPQPESIGLVVQRASLNPASVEPADAIRLQRAIGNRAMGRLVPPRPNQTGLPDGLKTGIEGLSGMSLDNVDVHYNSSQPARLNALAYAQGTDIHIGPGQERHLPHEAWHVVQQAQGRVTPTVQMKHGPRVNDDAGLEREADVMGGRALENAGMYPGEGRGLRPGPSQTSPGSTAQRVLMINKNKFPANAINANKHNIREQSNDALRGRGIDTDALDWDAVFVELVKLAEHPLPITFTKTSAAIAAIIENGMSADPIIAAAVLAAGAPPEAEGAEDAEGKELADFNQDSPKSKKSSTGKSRKGQAPQKGKGQGSTGSPPTMLPVCELADGKWVVSVFVESEQTKHQQGHQLGSLPPRQAGQSGNLFPACVDLKFHEKVIGPQIARYVAKTAVFAAGVTRWDAKKNGFNPNCAFDIHVTKTSESTLHVSYHGHPTKEPDADMSEKNFKKTYGF